MKTEKHLKRQDKQEIESFISDLRVLGYNWLDDDSRCVIDGFDGHVALDVTLQLLQKELEKLSLTDRVLYTIKDNINKTEEKK